MGQLFHRDLIAGLDEPDALPATAVSYDNTASGLAAGDAQAAIDELDAEKAPVGHTHEGVGSTTRWEVWVAGTPPEPVLTPDGTDWIYVEVTA